LAHSRKPRIADRFATASAQQPDVQCDEHGQDEEGEQGGWPDEAHRTPPASARRDKDLSLAKRCTASTRSSSVAISRTSTPARAKLASRAASRCCDASTNLR